MVPLTAVRFDCPRTCPKYGDRWCRFRPVLDALGPVRVDSHTARIKVEFTDPDALRRAVEAMGGIWYGRGHFDLHDTEQDGIGFHLPMADGCRTIDGKTYWYHPIVLRDDGELAYDEFGGEWGNVADLEVLKLEYAVGQVETAAQTLGWLTERTEAGLVVHHPDGGQLTLSRSGEVATAGFQGQSCHAAREALGIAVEPGSVVQTAEACQVPVTVQQTR